MRKNSLYYIGGLNCFIIYFVFWETFDPQGTANFAIMFSYLLDFGTYFVLHIFLLGLIALGLFIVSTVYIFLLNITISMSCQIVGTILYIIRLAFSIPLPVSFYMTTLLFSCGDIIVLVILIYSKVKLGFSAKFKVFEKGKLEKVMRVSNSINLEILREILNMDSKNFEDRIINYSKRYGMIVEGSNLIINKDTVDDFLNSLDEQFKKWEEMDKIKSKKF